MLYVIIGKDVPHSLELRKRSRTSHLRRLEQLRDEGRLVLAGPFPAVDSEEPGDAGFSGSLIVAEFDSLDEARHFAECDPYMAAGAFDMVTVKPFKQVLP